MNTGDSTTPFSFDLVRTGERLAAIFRPYPSLFDESECTFGKPLYIELADGDEPYPFALRSGLRGRTWWDLRYVLTEDKRVLAPTILTRDFAAKILGFSAGDSLLGRHLTAFPTESRLVSLDPFKTINQLRKNVDFRNRLDICIDALGLHDVKLGITGSFLLDQELSVGGRDLDLVVDGNQQRITEIARGMREAFLNKKYNELWPLRAVINDQVEVDLFFPPPTDVIKIVRSFKATGLGLEQFGGIVVNDHFSFYAPTILKCEDFVCIVLGTVIRGQYQCGEHVSGYGIPGRVTFLDKRTNAYLVEDATTHLEDAPRLRKND